MNGAGRTALGAAAIVGVGGVGCTLGRRRPPQPVTLPATASPEPSLAWVEMRRALSRAPTIHIRYRNSGPPGRRLPVDFQSDFWKQGDRWRWSSARHFRLFDGTRYRMFVPGDGEETDSVVLSSQTMSKAFGPHKAGGSDLVSKLAVEPKAMTALAPDERFLVTAPFETVALHGRRWWRIGRLLANHWSVELWIDLRTARPTRLMRGRTSHIIDQAEIRYEESPPADWLRPQLAQHAREVDIDAFEKKWLRPSLGRFDLAGARFAVHDLQVDAKGDVFLLYTGDPPLSGNTKRLASGVPVPCRSAIALTDGNRTAFLGGAAQDEEQRLPARCLFFTPRSSPPPSWPRRVTVTFSETWTESGQPRTAQRTLVRDFSRPSCERLPTFLAESGFRPENVARQRVHLHLADWQAHPPAADDRDIVREVYRDAGLAGRSLDGQRWLQLHRLLDRVGTAREAHEALQRAAATGLTSEVREALQREGI